MGPDGTTAAAGGPPAEPGRSWMAVVAGSAAFFVFSLGYYTREGTGWSSGEFDVEVSRFSAGIPPWLLINRVRSRGTPVSFEELPHSASFRPGIRIRGLLWPIAAALALSAGLSLERLGRSRFGKAVRGASPHWKMKLGAVGLLACGIGAIVPTEPNWVGAILGLLVLPACILALHPRLSADAVAACAGASLALWWGHRLGDHLRPKPLITGVQVFDDILLPVVLAGFLLAWIAGWALIRHILRKRLPSATA